MCLVVILMVALGLASPACAVGACVPIVEKGAAKVCIVVPDDAPKCCAASAAEFARWTKELTGVQLAVGSAAVPGLTPMTFTLDPNDGRVKEIGAKDERELQAWFTRHFAEYLGKIGRRVVGWDEVLHGDVPKSVIGMSWRMSAEGGVGGDFVSAPEAAAKGHDMVLTPSHYCYFSRRQGVSQDPFPYYEPEPFAEQKPRAVLTLEKAYSFDPFAGFPEHDRNRILGIQASVWTESILTRFDFEWKAWPRTCALAEIAWTGPGARTFDDFRRRMHQHRRRLVANHVNCAPVE